MPNRIPKGIPYTLLKSQNKVMKNANFLLPLMAIASSSCHRKGQDQRFYKIEEYNHLLVAN